MSLGLGRGLSDRNEVIPVAMVMTRYPQSIANKTPVTGEVRGPSNKFPRRLSRFNRPRYQGRNFVEMMHAKKAYSHLTQRKNNELRGTGLYEHQLRQFRRLQEMQKMMRMFDQSPKLVPVDKLDQVAEAKKEQDRMKTALEASSKEQKTHLEALGAKGDVRDAAIRRKMTQMTDAFTQLHQEFRASQAGGSSGGASPFMHPAPGPAFPQHPHLGSGVQDQFLSQLSPAAGP